MSVSRASAVTSRETSRTEVTTSAKAWNSGEIYALHVFKKGFRPSQWPEMVGGYDDAFGVENDPIHPLCLRDAGYSVEVDLRMLGPEAKDSRAQSALWNVIRVAGQNGLNVSVHPKLQESAPALYRYVSEQLERFGLTAQVRSR